MCFVLNTIVWIYNDDLGEDQIRKTDHSKNTKLGFQITK